MSNGTRISLLAGKSKGSISPPVRRIIDEEKVTERGEIEIQGTVRINTLDRGDGDVISQPDILVDNWQKL